jgi:hypothetical protein
MILLVKQIQFTLKRAILPFLQVLLDDLSHDGVRLRVQLCQETHASSFVQSALISVLFGNTLSKLQSTRQCSKTEMRSLICTVSQVLGGLSTSSQIELDNVVHLHARRNSLQVRLDQDLQVIWIFHIVHVEFGESVAKSRWQILLAEVIGRVHRAKESEVVVSWYLRDITTLGKNNRSSFEQTAQTLQRLLDHVKVLLKCGYLLRAFLRRPN